MHIQSTHCVLEVLSLLNVRTSQCENACVNEKWQPGLSHSQYQTGLTKAGSSVIHIKFTIIFPLSADSNGTGEADAKLKIDLKGKNNVDSITYSETNCFE